MAIEKPNLGHGIGLRPRHFTRMLEERPDVDWLEATSENFMAPGGRPVAVLEKVRRELPVVLHGVSLAIGSVGDFDPRYLNELRNLVRRIEPALLSDHLCWGRHGGRYAHDLWPLPYTEESLAHVVSRVQRVQEFLGRQIALENVSSYVSFRDSTLSEWDFLSQVAEQADCGILLDVNNVYVSARNHGFDPRAYLEAIPPARVVQFHLAGHCDKGRWILDSHDAPVGEEVWDLYRAALRRFGRVPTLIEWDDQIPPLDALIAESHKARQVEREVLAQ
jgi:uncharacterized protein (UPF0276 family)